MARYPGPLTAALLSLFLVAPAGALHDGALTEEDWLHDLPVTLSASRLAQTVSDAPVAISIIDRELIEQMGVRELHELLRLVPGMLVHHHTGHEPTVTYRSMATRYSRRILVLIDGRTAYSPIISTVNWTMLPLTIEDIERIEVIRGPNAAAYGANAMLGVVSITTRRPHQYSGVSTHLAQGNYGTYRAHVNFGDSRDALDWRATFEVSGDDGLRNLAGDEDDKDTAKLSGRMDWRDASGGTWSAQLGFAAGRRGEGRELQVFRPPHTIRTQNAHAQLEWASSGTADDRHMVNAYWLLDRWNQTYVTEPIEEIGGLQGAWDLSVHSDRLELEYQRSWTHGERIRNLTGVAGRLDRMRAPGYLGTPEFQQTSLLRLFSHHELQLTDRVVGNLGLMLEHDREAGLEFSPRLALNWGFHPGHVLRASWSRATRTPTIVESRADHFVDYGPFRDQLLFATGDLRSERIRSYELAWVYQNPAHDVTLELRLFDDSIDRLITYHFVPFDDADGIAQDFRNMDAADIRGGEIQAQWRPTPDTRIMLNYMHQDIDATDIDELYSMSGPRNLVSAFIGHRFTPSTTGSIVWFRVGEMHGMNSGHLIEKAERVDLKLMHDFDWAGNAARVSLTLQEPIGTYLDFRVRNRVDRRWLVQLGVRF